jgi:hypothetical protein
MFLSTDYTLTKTNTKHDEKEPEHSESIIVIYILGGDTYFGVGRRLHRGASRQPEQVGFMGRHK